MSSSDAMLPPALDTCRQQQPNLTAMTEHLIHFRKWTCFLSAFEKFLHPEFLRVQDIDCFPQHKVRLGCLNCEATVTCFLMYAQKPIEAPFEYWHGDICIAQTDVNFWKMETKNVDREKVSGHQTERQGCSECVWVYERDKRMDRRVPAVTHTLFFSATPRWSFSHHVGSLEGQHSSVGGRERERRRKKLTHRPPLQSSRFNNGLSQLVTVESVKNFFFNLKEVKKQFETWWSGTPCQL